MAGVTGDAVRNAPDLLTVITAGISAVGISALAWSVAGHAITIAHEGGHALVAVLRGRSVKAVTLQRNRDGLTELNQAGGFLFQFVGYLGPSVFGLAGALLLAYGYPDGVLWVSIGLLVFLLIAVRNVFGWLTVISTGLVMYGAVRMHAGDVQAFIACTWVWFLLVGGLAHVLLHRGGGGDHATLRQMTWIPSPIWVGLHLALAGSALALGAGLLLGTIDVTP